MKQGVPLVEEVVIRNVTRFRLERAWSQDRLAREVSLRTGWLWNRGTVMAIERGTRNLGVHEWFAIAVALDQPAWDFIASEPLLRFGPHSQGFKPSELQKVLKGTSTEVSAKNLGVKSIRRGSKAKVAAPLDGLQEAERNAAVKLKVEPQTIVAAAYKLWRQSLTEERERRIVGSADAVPSGRAMQAHRGHVTRELLTELQQELTSPK